MLGSARRPESMDQWSDVDLGLRLSGPVALVELLPPPVRVWAVDRQVGDRQSSCRLILADGRRLDLVVTGACQLTGTDPATDATVNEARFLAAQAVVKYGRGDRLIGSHLTLELAQLCLVQAMLLRDRDERTTSHRFGTSRDSLADLTWSALPSPGSPVDRIQRLTTTFDRLHGELEPSYVADWAGLIPLIRLLADD